MGVFESCAAARTGALVHTWRTDELLELTHIFSDATQVAVWRRQDPGALLSEYVASLARGSGEGKLLQQHWRPGQPFSLDGLPAQPGRWALLDDIATLVDIYALLLGCDAVGVRLEKLNRAMCPRFHVDRTGIRLLCTYCGPGTQWLDDRVVDRSRLGARAANDQTDDKSGLFPPGTAIEQADVFDVVLLKGSLWQGNGARGAIHRSPPIPAGGASRVMLALDALWD